jgi:hypothetical protein
MAFAAAVSALASDDRVDAAAFAALRREVGRLARRVARLERQQAARDDVADVAFLQLLARSTAGSAFSVAELRDHAAVDADLADQIRGASNKALGKRLRSLAGRRCGAFRLERIGRDGRGYIWIVQVVDDLHDTP